MYIGFNANLKFQNFKLALNPMYRFFSNFTKSSVLSCPMIRHIFWYHDCRIIESGFNDPSKSNRSFYSCVLTYLAMNASKAGGDLALIFFTRRSFIYKTITYTTYSTNYPYIVLATYTTDTYTYTIYAYLLFNTQCHCSLSALNH